MASTQVVITQIEYEAMRRQSNLLVKKLDEIGSKLGPKVVRKRKSKASADAPAETTIQGA
jgi:hypothetical protein